MGLLTERTNRQEFVNWHLLKDNVTFAVVVALLLVFASADDSCSSRRSCESMCYV